MKRKGKKRREKIKRNKTLKKRLWEDLITKGHYNENGSIYTNVHGYYYYFQSGTNEREDQMAELDE